MQGESIEKSLIFRQILPNKSLIRVSSPRTCSMQSPDIAGRGALGAFSNVIGAHKLLIIREKICNFSAEPDARHRGILSLVIQKEFT